MYVDILSEKLDTNKAVFKNFLATRTVNFVYLAVNDHRQYGKNEVKSICPEVGRNEYSTTARK